MVTMGVKWGGSRDTGIDLANTLAKAFLGDPETEMNLALGRSRMETDEYNRRQIDSATAWNMARADLEREKLAGQQGGVDPLAKLIAAGYGGPGGAAAPAPVVTASPDVPIPGVPTPAPRSPLEAPAPVTIPGVEAEPDYRISTYPMQPSGMAPEDPFQMVAPVEMPTGEYEPDFDISTAAASPYPGPQYPDDIDIAREAMPVGVNEFPPFYDPEMLRSVPPELMGPDMTQTDVPGRPLTEMIRDRPPPPSLQETMLPPVGEPAVVDIPGRTEEIAPITMGDRPPPIDPNLPLPGAAGEPPTATGDYLPAGTPTPPIQVLPGPQPDTVTVANASGQMVMTMEDFRALARMAIVNEGDIAGQAGKLAGLTTLQTGDRTDADAMRIGATLYTGNLPTEKTQITGQPAESTNPFEGDAEKMKLYSIVRTTEQKLDDPNYKPTTDEARVYDTAFNALYGTTTEYRQGANSSTIAIPTQGGQRYMVLNPKEVYRRAGVVTPSTATQRPQTTVGTGDLPTTPADVAATAPNPGALAPAPTAPPAAPVPAATAPAPVATNGGATTAPAPPTMQPTPQYAVNPAELELYDEKTGYTFNQDGSTSLVRVVAPGKEPKATEAMSRNGVYYFVASKANGYLDNMTAADVPTTGQGLMSQPDFNKAIGLLGPTIQSKLLTPENKMYMVNGLNFANAVMRIETGAASHSDELILTFQRFVPMAGDDETMVALKADYRDAVLKGIYEGALGEAATADELLTYAVQQTGKAAPQGGIATGTDTAPAPTTTPDDDINPLLDQYAPRK